MTDRSELAERIASTHAIECIQPRRGSLNADREILSYADRDLIVSALRATVPSAEEIARAICCPLGCQFSAIPGLCGTINANYNSATLAVLALLAKPGETK